MKLWDGEKYRPVCCTVEAAALTAAGFKLVDDDAPEPDPKLFTAHVTPGETVSVKTPEQAAAELPPAPKPTAKATKPEK